MNRKKIILAAVVLILAAAIMFDKNAPEPKDIPDVPYVGGPDGDLSEVKVAVIYEKVTDRKPNGRSLDQTVKMLKGTQADFIWLGFWTWTIPAPESPDNMPSELTDRIAEWANTATKNVPELVRQTGYSYEELGKSIPAIKKEMPGVIFTGGIPAEALGRVDVDPVTNKVIDADTAWSMAFDPKKWNISYECPEDVCKDYPSLKGKPLDKEGFQEYFALTNHLLKPGEKYDRKKIDGYFPDLTVPAFQELLVNRAKKQIDLGADGVFIDLLYVQAESLKTMTNDINHTAVRDSYDAAGKVIDAIHRYGESKEKRVYVGTWAEPVVRYPWPAPKLDFVTFTPLPEEIYYDKFNEERWDEINLKIENKFGNIARFAVLDFGWAKNSPTDVFSQMLDKEKQREWLKKADSFISSKGMIFVYPVHGGDFSPGAKRLSFGKNALYDSLAPEFDSYDTILELADKKNRD